MLCFAGALPSVELIGVESTRRIHRQREVFRGAANLLAQTLALHDEYTTGHNSRVAQYAYLLSQHLRLSYEQLELIRIGTPLHDIGKVGIDEAILHKPGALSDEEFEIMQSHTVRGAEILEPISELADVIAIVRSHHERWDGRGYPDRTVATETPLLARIVAVADAFDAMTSDRPYRKGMSAEAAFHEIAQQRGKQFDPEIATAFLAIKQRIVRAMWCD